MTEEEIKILPAGALLESLGEHLVVVANGYHYFHFINAHQILLPDFVGRSNIVAYNSKWAKRAKRIA